MGIDIADFLGVTFAAFGNGAPDIFSSLAAFSNSESGGLAFGELLGAAMFILTVVMGVVAIISPVSTGDERLRRKANSPSGIAVPCRKVPFHPRHCLFHGRARCHSFDVGRSIYQHG